MKKSFEFKSVFIAGVPDKRFDVTICGGKFASVSETAAWEKPADRDIWLAPGFIDLHLHLGWTDFEHADQQKRSRDEIERMQGDAMAATCRAGITTVRDAGGLLPADARRIAGERGVKIEIETCGAMLGTQDAGKVRESVGAAAAASAGWIKIFATGGLGAPDDSVLDPLLSKDDFFEAIRSAHSLGMKTMVHTWGGTTLDWAVDAGADTVEHCVNMTRGQAARLAQTGIPCIPTCAIYRIASDPHGPLALPEALCRRAGKAAEAQMKSVRYAKEEGVRIGFGTDFATPALHGRNLEELFALEDCGLTRTQAWDAAAFSAACILGLSDRLGRIKEGYDADAVVFESDPFKAENGGELRRSIATAVKSGAISWSRGPVSI
jgi:imidazolonepropionase-like amidohydrolase